MEIIIGILVATFGALWTSIKFLDRKSDRLKRELEQAEAEVAVKEYEQTIAESIDSHIADAGERQRMRDKYQREAKDDAGGT